MSKIFISYRSYRRDDSGELVDELDNHLAARFGRDNVFRDAKSTPLGQEYDKLIRDKLERCYIELVIIGPTWVDIKDARGKRRLDDSKDLVRFEVESGLQRGIILIPVLVKGANMPDEKGLPTSLKPLVKRHGIKVGDELGMDPEFSRLAAEIERKLPSNDCQHQ